MRSWSKVIRDFWQEGEGEGVNLGVCAINRQTAIFVAAAITAVRKIPYRHSPIDKPFTRRVSHKHSLPKKLAVHRVLYPSMLTESWVEGKSVEEKDAHQPREPQHYEDCQAKSIQEFGWTSQGMDWGWGQGIKGHHTQTCQGFGYSCRIPLVKPLLNHRQHQRRLTWAKEKKNWTVAQWSKVLFSDESKFCISFGNQGPRVWRKGGEAHSPSCMKSSVKFHSLWWFGVHVICWCWSIVFFENQRHCTRLPRNFGALHASFCWPAF